MFMHTGDKRAVHAGRACRGALLALAMWLAPIAVANSADDPGAALPPQEVSCTLASRTQQGMVEWTAAPTHPPALLAPAAKGLVC